MRQQRFDWTLWQRSLSKAWHTAPYPFLDEQQHAFAQMGIERFHPAAVMVLVEAGHDAQVVLTVRSSNLSHHPGQVAFAGGKRDRGDADLVATALRETQEELGIAPQCIEVLGQMPPLPTISAYCIHPVIGVLHEPTAFVPNADEVARVFSVPLAALMQPESYQSYAVRRRDHLVQTVKFPHQEHIWGATATILLGLAQHYRSFTGGLSDDIA